MSRNQKEKRKKKGLVYRMLIWLLWLAFLGALCYGGLIAWVYHQEVSVPEPVNYDGIIVLGAQVQPSGEPSVQLRWRLDRAKELYWTHPCYVVVTGGQGSNEPEAEGDVMRRLLVAEGLEAEMVISDPVSVDTRQNLDNAWKILREKGCQKPVVVTSDYHLPRALALMKDMGLEAQGAGSLCRPEIGFWLKNHMREALAWVKYWCVKYVGISL